MDITMLREKRVPATKYTLLKNSPGDKIFMFTVYAILICILLLVLLPLVYVVAASFSSPAAVVSGKVWLWPVDPTTKGYEAVFKNPKILTGFKNSFFYMFTGVIVNLIMTMLCAYPLTRREFRARGVITGFLVFTMYFNGGIVPTYMVVKNLGLIDTPFVMVLPVALSVWNVILCRTYISSTIPDTLYEAASLDGCTPIAFLIKIVFPLSTPILAVLALYYGIGHWNTYFNALIYLNKVNLQPLQIILREVLVQNKIDPTMISDVRELSAKQGLTDLLKYSVIVVASVPVMCIYPFVQKYFVKGVMIGSVKG